jgi:hypothetical protein
LAHLATDRSMTAALASQAPLTVGASARIVTHTLASSGHLSAAIATARNHSLRLDRQNGTHTPESLSVYGSVLLRGALAAAQRDDRATAHKMLAEAAGARRLGTDANLRGTGFGPVNTQMHQVNVAVTLGDAGTAIDLARQIDLRAVTVTERKASLLIDVARAFFQWGKYEQAHAALRDSYAVQTAWAPRHVGKELRLSRLGAFDVALGVIRAGAEADAARKTGDHDRAARHEHLAASYRALRDHYQQQEQGFAQAMVARQEWEEATAGSRRLAIAADTELRRRHPHQKIEPLRSGEPAAVSDTGREQLSPGPDEKLTERVTRIRDLAAQRQASRAEMDEHPGLMVPGEDPVWGERGDAFPDSRASGPDAILQPPRPEIIPSARLLQLAAEHDSEPDREAAD